MAKYTRDSVVFRDNSEIPSDIYTVKFTSFIKKQSSTDRPMIEASCSIVSPETVQVGDKTIMVQGRSFKMYNLLDPVETYGLGQLVDGLTRGGLNPTEVFELPEDEIWPEDDNNKVLAKMVNKTCNMRLFSEQSFMMTKPTQEERRRGIKPTQQLGPDGSPIKIGFAIKGDFSNITGPADQDGAPY